MVQLDAGKTIVNLVFRKVYVEGLSTTNTSFVTNMQRVVSDKTHEYPDNENHTFKVRLPAPLHLSGHGWEVALYSLSMPATSHRHNALLSTSKKPIHVDFCIHEVASSSFRMSRVYDTSEFIGGRQRSGHDEKFKTAFR